MVIFQSGDVFVICKIFHWCELVVTFLSRLVFDYSIYVR